MSSNSGVQQGAATTYTATSSATAGDLVGDQAELAQRYKDAPRYIAVEGPIGVGKTTLSKRLAETFGFPLLLEPAAENPFLDRFYRDPEANALPTQLFFLLHRVQQMQDIGTGGLVEPNLVADFLIEKDRLFAELTLDAEEFDLYEQIYKSVSYTHLTLPTKRIV